MGGPEWQELWLYSFMGPEWQELWLYSFMQVPGLLRVSIVGGQEIEGRPAHRQACCGVEA